MCLCDTDAIVYEKKSMGQEVPIRVELYAPLTENGRA